MENSKKNIIINGLIAIVSVAVVAVIGRLLTNANSEWFLSLNKPTQFIPPVAFPIMWSLIYVSFAIVIYLLLRNNQMDWGAITLLGLNGLLQIIWSLVYFRLHSIIGGLVVLAVLIVETIMMIFDLIHKEKYYGHILVLYPIWLIIAMLANTAIWILN